MSERINILIVDDHLMFLEGLKALFQDENDFQIVDVVTSGDKALQVLKSKKVDIVVTDLSMPEMSGIDLNRIIKKDHKSVKTLVLSTYNDPEKINTLMKTGVEGYLLKNSDPDQLRLAIRELANGNKFFSDEVREKYTNSLFSAKQSDSQVKLSKREKEILKLIADEYTTLEIAEALFISEYTVNTHRRNLLTKLNVKNTAGLVKKAIQLDIT